MPLMQPEFGNPLFLHLVCQLLQDRGEVRLPSGMLGITEVIRQLISTKNEKIAEAIDYDPLEQRVQKAISAIIRRMAEKNERMLIWEEAKTITDEISPAISRTTSLFDRLFREGLLSRVTRKTSDADEVQVWIRFTFERLADHLLAEHYLKSVNAENLYGVFQPGGILYFTVEAAHACQGLLEALAIQIPEKFGVELDELITNVHQTILMPVIIGSLTWRSPESITSATARLMEKSLHAPCPKRIYA